MIAFTHQQRTVLNGSSEHLAVARVPGDPFNKAELSRDCGFRNIGCSKCKKRKRCSRPMVMHTKPG